MNISKSSRYVLQKTNWLSSSSYFLIPSKTSDKNLSIKFPKEDPLKPPLRLNIPKDSQQHDAAYSKYIREKKSFPSEPRSKSVVAKPTSNLGPNIKEYLFSKSETDFQYAFVEDDENLSVGEKTEKLNYNRKDLKNNSESDNLSNVNKVEEKPNYQPQFSVFKRKLFSESDDNNSVDEKSNTLSQTESAERYSVDLLKCGKNNSTASDDNSESNTLYIVINVPENEEKLAKVDTDSVRRVKRVKLQASSQDDYVMYDSQDSQDSQDLTTGPETKVTRSEQSFNSYKSKSSPEWKLSKGSQPSKSDSKMRFEVREIDDAATYVFHLKFKRKMNEKSSKGYRVPEKEICSKLNSLGLEEDCIKEISPAKNLKGSNKETGFTQENEAPKTSQYSKMYSMYNTGDVSDKHINSSEIKSNTQVSQSESERYQYHNQPEEYNQKNTFFNPSTENQAQKNETQSYENSVADNDKFQEYYMNRGYSEEARDNKYSAEYNRYNSSGTKQQLDYNFQADREKQNSENTEYFSKSHKSRNSNYGKDKYEKEEENPSEVSDPSKLEYMTVPTTLRERERENKKSNKRVNRGSGVDKKRKYTTKHIEFHSDSKIAQSFSNYEKLESDITDFQKSPRVINIKTESSDHLKKFCAALPPIISSAKSRFKRPSFLKRDFFLKKRVLNQFDFEPTNFEMNSKCPKLDKVAQFLEDTMIFSENKDKKVEVEDDSLLQKDIILNVAKSKSEVCPKISDNIANVANKEFTENKGSASLDSLAMMKKVKEIVDFDLKNAIKLFDKRDMEESQSVPSVVTVKGSNWNEDEKELPNCVDTQKSNTTEEINVASNRKSNEIICRSKKDDDSEVSIPKYLPPKEEKTLSLQNDLPSNTKSTNDVSVLHKNDFNKKIHQNDEELTNDGKQQAVVNNCKSDSVLFDIEALEEYENKIEPKKGDSIVIFDENTQTWRVDYSILEKREKILQEENELTKRSALILEKFEKLEQGKIPNIPRPDSPEKRTFDYGKEEWKVYSPETKKSETLPKEKLWKEKSPFKESDAEEIRKKNSDLYENLFVIKKKDAQMNKNAKEAPGLNKNGGNQGTKKEAKVGGQPTGSETPTKNSETPIEKSDQPTSNKNPVSNSEESFWESFLKMDIPARKIANIPRPLPSPPIPKQQPPPSPPPPRPIPRIEIPKPNELPPPKDIHKPIEVPKQKENEDSKFKLPFPFRGDKKHKNISKKNIPAAKKENPKKLPDGSMKEESKKPPPLPREEISIKDFSLGIAEKKKEPKFRIPFSGFIKSPVKKEEPKIIPPPLNVPPKTEEATLEVPPPNPPSKNEEPKLQTPSTNSPFQNEEPKLQTPSTNYPFNSEEPNLQTPPTNAPSKKEEPKIKAASTNITEKNEGSNSPASLTEPLSKDEEPKIQASSKNTTEKEEESNEQSLSEMPPSKDEEQKVQVALMSASEKNEESKVQAPPENSPSKREEAVQMKNPTKEDEISLNILTKNFSLTEDKITLQPAPSNFLSLHNKSNFKPIFFTTEKKRDSKLSSLLSDSLKTSLNSELLSNIAGPKKSNDLKTVSKCSCEESGTSVVTEFQPALKNINTDEDIKSAAPSLPTNINKADDLKSATPPLSTDANKTDDLNSAAPPLSTDINKTDDLNSAATPLSTDINKADDLKSAASPLPTDINKTDDLNSAATPLSTDVNTTDDETTKVLAPPGNDKKEKNITDHYISKNIIELTKNSIKEQNPKKVLNKFETVKLNITSDKRLPSKITEINLNKKCEEMKESKNQNKKEPTGGSTNKAEKFSKEDKTFYKDFEKYKTPFSDPAFEEKPLKINADMESNPNLKKLENWNKTLVLHDVMKPPENVESWLKDETDKMASLLLKVLQEASDEKTKKKLDVPKNKPCEKVAGKGKSNPYDKIRKKQETTPESFLIKIRTVNSTLEDDKKLNTKNDSQSKGKPEPSFNNLPIQPSNSIRAAAIIEAVKVPPPDKEYLLPKVSLSEVKLLRTPTACFSKTKPKISETALETLDATTRKELMSLSKLDDLTDEIPGPEILKKISNTWRLLPVISCQMTIFTLLRISQLVNVGGAYLNASDPERSRKNPFRKIFAKYGPIVNVQGPLSGNVILIHQPDHLTSIFEQDATYVRSVFDSLERTRRETEDKFQSSSVATDWNKSEWSNLKKTMNDPAASCKKFIGGVELAGETLVSVIRRNRNSQNVVAEDFMEVIKKWSMEGLCNVLFERAFNILDGREIKANWASEPEKLYLAFEEATGYLSKCERGFQTWRIMTTPAYIGLVQACRSMSNILQKQLFQAERNLKTKNDLYKKGRLLNPPELTFTESMLLHDGMTQKDIICNLMDILLIGVNVMSSAMGFLLYNLAQNIKVQKKLLQELKEILPEKDSILDHHKLHSLKYLQACLKESLRLHIPVPIFYRVLQNDILLSNYFVPKGTYVIMDSVCSTMKNQVFDEPDKFIPERWLKEENWLKNYHPFSCFPICHGPKAELAKRVIEVQLLICIAKVVRNFTIDYQYGEIQETDGLITLPNKPLKLNFIEREE